ncbi:oxidoreductase [Jiangella anatolica]|uniref:oxidoreductase n=1 Tax=Jiangella anatolica TaxID=2670374 RepID=UPI0018F38D33|nr:oxidoreductase [Jiangella anatolica]
MDDPLAGVLMLTGVGAAAAQARSSVDALLRHPAMRRDAGRIAALSALRGAQASAALDGGDPDTLGSLDAVGSAAADLAGHGALAAADGVGADRAPASVGGSAPAGGPPLAGGPPPAGVPALAGGPAPAGGPGAGGHPGEAGEPGVAGDPVLQGALRVTAAVPELAQIWSRSPRQALARLHVLAARDLVADPDQLGRPRASADAERLDQLLRLATAPTAAPGVVVAAIVHGELLALRPFGTADGVVARAAERVVLVALGVDTKAAGVPEAGHLALQRAYEPLARAYAEGRPEGVGAWVRQCADAYARGAEVGLTLAERVRAAAS